MYAAVIFVGINNCQTVQPIVAIERTVFYRERAAGMYAPMPYAIAQVGGWLICLKNYYMYLLVHVACYDCHVLLTLCYATAFSIAGCHRITICAYPNHILLTHSVCYGGIWMESGKVLLVHLCQLLLLLVLHILRNDDCFHHTKPSSGFDLCSSILWSLQPLLRFLHSKTSEYHSISIIILLKSISIRMNLI